jgi:hypothetical protein
MPTRLLSLLASIEKALLAETPAPAGGSWDNSRMVNYQSGLARLTLASRSDAGSPRPVGTIFLQSFDLADGSFCLKANICWTDGPGISEVVHAIYEKPGMDWDQEARQIAAKWIAGPSTPKLQENPKLEESREPLAAAG